MSVMKDLPLCVDLDGTLVNTDMLFECVLRLLKSEPLYIFLIPIWLMKGKAVLKKEIVKRVTLEDLELSLNDDVVRYLRRHKSQRNVLLITGSDQKIAEYVAGETDLFNSAHGSDGHTNLTSKNKRDWLVDKFGEGGFDYMGNDTDDRVVWSAARHALLVGGEKSMRRFSDIEFIATFETKDPQPRDFFSLLRIHQWTKNALIFIPFLLDKTVQTWPNFVTVILAFLAMSLLASMTYIVNDMLDLNADRKNPTKKNRALAACRISLQTGVLTGLILFLTVLALLPLLPLSFSGALLLYLVCTLYYSFYLKKRMVIDVCTIAGLHTLRIIAGVFAVQAIWSFWLLAFSMFVFFSLAVAKRVSELTNLKDAGRDIALGRGYLVSDIPMLSAIGVSAGYISVLVVALFVNSEKVAANYSQPMLLWLLCPLLMYWIGRLWLITARGNLHEDPIVFAVRDQVSQAVVALLAIVLAAASLL